MDDQHRRQVDVDGSLVHVNHLLVLDGGFNRGLTGSATRWEALVAHVFDSLSAMVASVRNDAVRVETWGNLRREYYASGK